VPILNGTNRDEERIFVSFGHAISRGTELETDFSARHHCSFWAK
jgi:hypothetical protein